MTITQSSLLTPIQITAVVGLRILEADEHPSEKTETVRIELDSFGDSGIDQNGGAWTRFEVDYFAQQEAGTCNICEVDDLEFGWLLLDGGEEICDSHVEVS